MTKRKGGVRLGVFIGPALLLLLSSCAVRTRTVEVPVPVESVRVERVVERVEAVDSVWLHDSVYVDRSRDTVLVERWHTRWRERRVTDTVAVARVDTVTVTKTLRVESSADSRGGWLSRFSGAWGCLAAALAALGAAVVWWLARERN